MPDGVFLHPVNAGKSDSPLGYVDNTAHRQVILAVIYRLQIGQQVFDLSSCVEIDAAHDLVRNISVHELFFKDTGLRVCPV